MSKWLIEDGTLLIIKRELFLRSDDLNIKWTNPKIGGNSRDHAVNHNFCIWIFKYHHYHCEVNWLVTVNLHYLTAKMTFQWMCTIIIKSTRNNVIWMQRGNKWFIASRNHWEKIDKIETIKRRLGWLLRKNDTQLYSTR